MALDKFVSDWNDSFESKITVGDIKKPTQSFLFQILQVFLASIHIDCDKLKGKMDEHHYKILLVKYFNEFFKACSFKCSFLYGDLIQPTSKKTCEIMRFLVNYRQFFKVVQDEVVATANAKIETYNELLGQKNQLQLQQEEFKIRTEKKEMELKESTRLIAEWKQLLENLEVESKTLTKDTDIAGQQIRHIQAENIRLNCETAELDLLIVAEDELKSLFGAIKASNDEFCELDSLQQTLVSNNECYHREIAQLRTEIDAIPAISNESSVLELVEKYRDEIKNHAEMKNKVKDFQNQIENSLAKRNELLESIKSLKAQLLKKRNDLSSLLENSQIKLMATESEHKRALIHTANYEKKLELAEQQVEELKSAQEHLITMGIEVVEQIENSEWTYKMI